MILKVYGVDDHGLLSIRPAPTEAAAQNGDQAAFFQTQGSAVADFLLDHLGSMTIEQIINDLTLVLSHHRKKNEKGLRAEVKRLAEATKLHLKNMNEGEDEDAGEDPTVSND